MMLANPWGGGGSWGSGLPPHPFWGTPKLHKEGKVWRVRAQIRQVLVLNSYPDRPLYEILYPPLPKWTKLSTGGSTCYITAECGRPSSISRPIHIYMVVTTFVIFTLSIAVDYGKSIQ